MSWRGAQSEGGAARWRLRAKLSGATRSLARWRIPGELDGVSAKWDGV
jgi:hypothetical protein